MEPITGIAGEGYSVESKGTTFTNVIYINPINGQIIEHDIKMAVYDEAFKNSFGDVVPFTRRVEGISYTDAKKALAKATGMFPEVRAISIIGSAPVTGVEKVTAFGYSTSNFYIQLGSGEARVAIAPACLLLGNTLTRDALIDMISRVKPGLFGEILDARP